MYKFGLKRIIESDNFDITLFIPVFHKWIQDDKIRNHIMIDVADYKHIPFGPGIMLIAFEGNFSIGYEEHGFGLSYNRKISFRESEEKSLHKIKNILDNVVDLILNEESLREEIQFLNEYILYSNDRYEFPNNLENGNKLKQLAVSSFDKPIISSLNNNTKNRLSINIKEVNNECKISTSNG